MLKKFFHNINTSSLSIIQFLIMFNVIFVIIHIIFNKSIEYLLLPRSLIILLRNP
jgi:hypothetical protein